MPKAELVRSSCCEGKTLHLQLFGVFLGLFDKTSRQQFMVEAPPPSTRPEGQESAATIISCFCKVLSDRNLQFGMFSFAGPDCKQREAFWAHAASRT